MMTWVGEHGVRVPQVFDADGPDLVMERIDGAAKDGLAREPWRLGPSAGCSPTCTMISTPRRSPRGCAAR